MEPYRERIEDFLRRWRSRYEEDRVFRVLVITVVLAACAVTSAGLQQTPTYEASAQMLVGWQHEGRWQTLEYRETPPTQEIMHTIGIRSLAQEAIQRLELRMDPDELLDNLTVEQVESTSFIRIAYESTDPVLATRTVNTVGEVISELVSERSGTLTADVYEKAMVPETPVSPHPFRNGLLTLVIGLMLCAGTVVALPGARPIRQGAGQAGVLGSLGGRRRAPGIVERVNEKKLLRALGRHGKLTAVEAALATSLSVEEANRMLFELAAGGHLQVIVEHGRLYYAFWERD